MRTAAERLDLDVGTGGRRAVDLLIGGIDVLDLEEAALLRRVPTVLGQPDLDLVSGEDHGLVGRLLSGDDAEAKGLIVVGDRCLEIRHGEVHRVLLVGMCGQEYGFHRWFLRVFDRVVGKLLAYKPEDRFASTDELGVAIAAKHIQGSLRVTMGWAMNAAFEESRMPLVALGFMFGLSSSTTGIYRSWAW